MSRDIGKRKIRREERRESVPWTGSWVREWGESGWTDRAVFLLLLLLYTGVTLYLFVMQCYEVPDFVSDMPAYVDKVRGIQGEYEFPYPLFFALARGIAFLGGAPLGVALAAALLNSLGVCVVRGYMGRALRDIFPGPGGGKAGSGGMDLQSLGVTLLTFSLFLLGNLYSPKNTAFFGFDYAYRCMGIYTPNPIWNATYLATRPFAAVCFFEGHRMLEKVEALWRGEGAKKTEGSGRGENTGKEESIGRAVGFIERVRRFPYREALPFALSLLLTTLTKPSFTMVFLPGMGLWLLLQLARSQGRSFPHAFALCLTMIPTVADLLYQFFGVFSGVNALGEETGMGFAFARVWSNYSSNIPLSILMGMALPIGVLILNPGELWRNASYRFAWWLYLVSGAMFLCLYEKGFRMLHANFSWGYMHGMFFVFLWTLLLLYKNTVQWRKSYKLLFVLGEWAVFFYHLVCGVNFFVYALQGKELAGF